MTLNKFGSLIASSLQEVEFSEVMKTIEQFRFSAFRLFLNVLVRFSS